MTTTRPLAGRTALVTGSTGGIGHALAQALAAAGADVLLHGPAPEAGTPEICEALSRTHGVRVAYLVADLADAGSIAAMMARAGERGGVDILVNNAVTRHFAPIESMPVAAWDEALAVNVSAAFHTIRLALPGMRARGYGRIFNMTSVYGLRAVPNRIDYITSKAALQGMTRAVAMETINQGITCNAICPGSVLTPSIDERVQSLMRERGVARDQAEQAFLAGKQPIGRFVDVAHVAELVVFLCGPAGRDITGAMLPVEGGWLAS